jgi:hypothetical protein
MRLDVYLHTVPPDDSAIAQKLDRIAAALTQLGTDIMATLEQILADVTDESTRIDSLVALLNGIEQQLKDLLTGVVIPSQVQAKIDALFDGVEANKAKVQAAIDANTPPAPAP